jgi:hypothetical protein
VDIDGKHCVVVGLDGDAERRPFGHVLELVPHWYSRTFHLCDRCGCCGKRGGGAMCWRRGGLCSSMSQTLFECSVSICRYRYNANRCSQYPCLLGAILL